MGNYGDLTEAEQAHWNEYTTIRQLKDWPGYDEAMDGRRADARQWIVDRRDYLVQLANGEVDGQPAGWDTNNRKARYDFLGTMNSGAPKHEVTLPCSGSATDTEKVYIEEREGYLAFGSTTDAQKQRKLDNLHWLQDRRKRLWHLMRDDPDANKANDRQTRYDNLCIATSHGQAYEDWAATHNKWGQPISSGSSGKSSRSKCKDWLDSYVGTVENPKGSNKGSPQPSQWQKRVYGSDGVPWCACFAVCSAWDNGVSGSGTASVCNNRDLAKKGQGIYRGWTTDPSKVRAGDHAFIGCDHTGVIYDAATLTTVEGNTSGSTSSGDQWNGDLVAKKTRPAGYWNNGYGLVRFPDD